MKPAIKIVGLGITLAAGHAVAAGPEPTPILREEDVPPYTLPDPLVCQDGTPVKDATTWWNKRRPELLALFTSEIYGRTLLGRPDSLRFVLRDEKQDARGGLATRLRVGVLFEGTEDGRQMELLVYLPNRVRRPAPLFVGLNFDGNYATTTEKDIPVPKHWATGLAQNHVRNNVTEEFSRGVHAGQWQYDYALEHGYGVATAAYGEIEADADNRWREGPRGMGPEPGPGDWGEIGGWAWALSRAMDYLETNPRVDPHRVVLIGFSRLGKTALWAGAQDPRFAIVVSNCSGGGGAALSKRIFGETVFNLTNVPARWFCTRFKHYANNEAELPIDQHELIALIAPRPVLITSAREDNWSDAKGEFLSALAADPVFRLLGVGGLDAKEWPEPGALVNSHLGYFVRDGKHDRKVADWKAMVAFADKHLPR